MDNKSKFRDWLISTGRTGAARAYPAAVDRVSKHYLDNNENVVPIYDISSQTEISRIVELYSKSGKFSECGDEHNSRNRSAITSYAAFFANLNEELVSSADDSENSAQQPNGEQSNFKYERDLQTAFCVQISSLFPGCEILGQQYSVGGKRIDVLLEDKNGDLLVVELKAGRADYAVFGQISMYIGMLSQLPKFSGKKVRGVIVVGGADDGLMHACRTNPDISVKIYQMRIELEDSDMPDIADSESDE